jgi:hypothetical protein
MKKVTSKNSIKDFEWALLWSSLRYFVGRETIASATFPASVIEHCFYRLSENQKRSLAKEVWEHLEQHGRVGHQQIDQPHWLKFAAALETEKHIEVMTIDGNIHTCFKVNGRFYPLDIYVRNPNQETYLPEENIMDAE